MADEAIGNPVKELGKRFFITFLLGVIVYRIGVVVPIPEVDPEALKNFIGQDGTLGSILRLANMFNGGAIAQASIFGLGIMPYISASIIFQLLAASYPSLKQLQKEGESGRRKINQYTRYATVAICLIQSGLAAAALTNITTTGGDPIVIAESKIGFVIQSMLVVTTGSMVLLWLAEQITKFGIGNGVSVIIMIGILSAIPGAMLELFDPTAGVDLPIFLGIIAVFLAIIAAMVLISLARRKINLEQQRRIQGNKVYGGGQTQLPLMLNQANVIPVIFASPVMFVFVAIVGLLGLSGLIDQGMPLYRLLFAGLVIFFTYFYISITFDLNDLANHFKQAGFFIRGVRPGKNTVDYIRHRVHRITFVGALSLAFIAISPDFIASGFQISSNIANAVLGGVGLLIVVGVSLDIIQKTSSFLLAHQYQGLMNQTPGAQTPRKGGKGGGKRF
jgi:preprotein translocase subunit SecY